MNNPSQYGRLLRATRSASAGSTVSERELPPADMRRSGTEGTTLGLLEDVYEPQRRMARLLEDSAEGANSSSGLCSLTREE